MFDKPKNKMSSQGWLFLFLFVIYVLLLEGTLYLPYKLVDSLLIIITGIFVFSLIYFTFKYLQTGTTRETSSKSASNRLEEELQKLKYELRELPNLSERLSHLETQLEKGALSVHAISDDQRIELINSVKESIKKAGEGEFINEIRNSLRLDQATYEVMHNQHEQHTQTTERLNEELSSLTRRGNLNLLLGIITATIGILLLGEFVLSDGRSTIGIVSSTTGTKTPIEDEDILEFFTINFLPRVSLVILIEIFAYFFLRLYSNSLMEIKYFQNEITNLDTKFLALQTAVSLGDKKSIEEIISQLAQTERNYVLQKGQTTVGLERSKIEQETVTSLSQNLLKAFSNKQQS